jgi:UDP-N-acetyl-D-mannosaminuronate dehydrogenase
VAESIGVPQLGDVGFGLAIKNQDVGKVIGFDAAQLALPA